MVGGGTQKFSQTGRGGFMKILGGKKKNLIFPFFPIGLSGTKNRQIIIQQQGHMHLLFRFFISLVQS